MSTRLAVTIFMFFFLTGFPTTTPAGRIQPENLAYKGAFRLPDAFNWGARGISFYPSGNGGKGTLLVTGFELLSSPDHPQESCWDESWNCRAYYGEIVIPEPALATNFADLPTAVLVNNFVDFDHGLASTVHREYVFVSGIEYVPKRGTQTSDKIYGSINLWYAEGVAGEESFPTVWMADKDGTSASGMFHVGPWVAPFHGRKTGSYLFSVPKWYADDYLGGRTLVTGRSRGTPTTGNEPVTTNGGSQGPTLFAFHPFDFDTPTGYLDGFPVLYYRVKFPGCAGPNAGDPGECDYPGFTMCDDWTGGAFLNNGSSQAFIFLGYKGLGANCYDEPPVVCNDPCGDAHGYHCHPYERQVIFYDANELGGSARGDRDPWTVLPYHIWRPTEFFLKGETCWNTGGMTFDPVSRKLFMVERGLGGEINSSVIHVYQLNAEETEVIYVDFEGICGGKSPCHETINEAINENEGNLTVHVRSGTYPEKVIHAQDRNLEITGGWNQGFTVRGSFSSIHSLTVSGGTVLVNGVYTGGSPASHTASSDINYLQSFRPDELRGIRENPDKRGARKQDQYSTKKKI